MSAIHRGKMQERAKLQLEGCVKKIQYLESELETAEDDNASECHLSASSEEIYYDGHIFRKQKQLSGYCSFCDEPHYSISLSCELCDITVHRQCYMLAMSCDMCKSVKKGRGFMIEMKNFEEAERLVKILKKNF